MSLDALAAKVGTNPYWIAANAHFWFAFALVVFFPSWYVVGLGLFLAAWKEFLFDAQNETAPKQTAFDNWTDFAGYAGGLILGAIKMHLF